MIDEMAASLYRPDRKHSVHGAGKRPGWGIWCRSKCARVVAALAGRFKLDYDEGRELEEVRIRGTLACLETGSWGLGGRGINIHRGSDMKEKLKTLCNANPLTWWISCEVTAQTNHVLTATVVPNGYIKRSSSLPERKSPQCLHQNPKQNKTELVHSSSVHTICKMFNSVNNL